MQHAFGGIRKMRSQQRLPQHWPIAYLLQQQVSLLLDCIDTQQVNGWARGQNTALQAAEPDLFGVVEVPAHQGCHWRAQNSALPPPWVLRDSVLFAVLDEQQHATQSARRSDVTSHKPV